MPNTNTDSDFSAILASSVHDMKNSLCMLLGALDEIMNNCDPSHCPSFEGFSHVRYEGNRVNHSLMQLLSLYRIENNQYALHINENELHDCLEECFLESEGLLELKGIESVLNCEENLMWYFDRNLITGMLNSVINNAYKYTKSIIQISATVEKGYLVICVEDDGHGYPEAMLHEENENQPSADINYKSSSTGLGLYFARIIARLHENKGKKGYITTQNKGFNGGGKFSIYLP